MQLIMIRKEGEGEMEKRKKSKKKWLVCLVSAAVVAGGGGIFWYLHTQEDVPELSDRTAETTEQEPPEETIEEKKEDKKEEKGESFSSEPESVQEKIKDGKTEESGRIPLTFVEAETEFENYLQRTEREDNFANYVSESISRKIFENSIRLYDADGILWELYDSVGRRDENFTGYDIAALVNELTMYCEASALDATRADYLGYGKLVYKDPEDRLTKQVTYYVQLNDPGDTILECEFHGLSLKKEEDWCYGIETSGNKKENLEINLRGKKGVKANTSFKISDLDKETIQAEKAEDIGEEEIGMHGEAENFMKSGT